jgi:hypothetical protein
LFCFEDMFISSPGLTAALVNLSHKGQKSTIVFYKYLVINQYRIFISQQSADKVIKWSKLANFYFFDNIMPSTSYYSNIIALQRQFPNILRKDAEGVARK